MTKTLDLVELVGRLMPAGNPTDSPFNAEKAGVAFGIQLGYVAEKMKAIADGALASDERSALLDQVFALERFAKRFESGLYQGDVLRADRDKLLLADINLTISTAGSMAHQTKRWHEAMQAVVQAAFDGKRPDVGPYVVQPQD